MIIFGLILDLILKFIFEKWYLKWHKKCAENGPRMATVNNPNAIYDAQHDDSNIKVYTNRSGMEGRIGAAAVLYRGGRRKASIWYKLGSQNHHTVYEGEGIGIILGIKLMTKEWGIRSATLCVDNQATIRATQLMKPHPGHYLTNIFHKDLKALKEKHNSI